MSSASVRRFSNASYEVNKYFRWEMQDAVRAGSGNIATFL